MRLDGRAIRRARIERGWTQDDLAARAGVPRKTISDIENDRSSRSLPRTIRRLCDALGVEPRDVLAPEEGAA